MPNLQLKEPVGSDRFTVRRILAWLMISLALVYLLYFILPNSDSAYQLILKIGFGQIALTVLSVVPMFFLKAFYHADLMRRIGGKNATSCAVFSSYLQAQLVRYLPGKIWGIFYQTQKLGRTHRPEHVVLANLSQMLTTNALAVGVVASMLGCAWFRSLWPLLTLVPTIVIIEFTHRNPRTEKFILIHLKRWLPQRFTDRDFVGILPSRWLATGILLSEWVFHYLMIIVLLHGVMDITDSIILGSWYAGASLISLAAIMVPAGIAVREAVFVSAASFLPGDSATLIAIAALLRICLIAAEIVAALIGTLARRVRVCAD